MSEEGMGVLDVFVFKASGLVKMDLTGLCDPYVTLTMTNDDGTGGGKVKRTKYIRQNLNPEFNQEFHFTVYKLSQMLVIKVYDHDDLGADDLMGTRRIPVAELVEKRAAELEARRAHAHQRALIDVLTRLARRLRLGVLAAWQT